MTTAQMSTQEAEHTLAQMKARVTELLRQINTLEMDAGEHRLVADALLPLDDNRKCFRMVGSVIVERTVAEVLPAVQKNMEQMNEVKSKLMEALNKAQKDAEEFAAEHKIASNGGAGGGGGGLPSSEAEADSGASGQGVLI